MYVKYTCIAIESINKFFPYTYTVCVNKRCKSNLCNDCVTISVQLSLNNFTSQCLRIYVNHLMLRKLPENK